MIYRKVLIACFLCLLADLSFSQNKCSHTVSLMEIKETSNSTMKVEFKVEGSGRFDGKLMRLNSDEIVVKAFSGSGSERVSLEDLNKALQYKIVITFQEEEKFICKTKVLPDIFISNQ